METILLRILLKTSMTVVVTSATLMSLSLLGMKSSRSVDALHDKMKGEEERYVYYC